MGTQRITSRQIATRPHGNGTITDLLHDNPNVQFSNISGTSESAGEIAPENVSFHGEKFYNNNWQIDGMRNTDNSNPGAGAGYQNSNDSDMDGLPNGGAQSFWVNVNIIDNVDVYDSNISAKYGQFTGGVVDAKLKDSSSKKASGSISLRTSRGSGSRYHAEIDVDASKVQQGNYYQPDFTKYIWGLNLNQTINERAALMFSCNRTQSSIPFYHTVMKQKEGQKRLSQTFVLKGLYRFDNGDAVKATAMYSPHESKYLRASTKAGAYTNSGGGYRFNLEWKHLFDKGHVDTYLGVQSTRNRVENEADYHISYSLYKRLPSATAAGTNPRCSANAVCEPNLIPSWLDWVSTLRTTDEVAGRYYPDLAGKIGDSAAAIYGGYGTFETTRKSLVAKQDYLFRDLEWGKTKYTLAFGWSADWAVVGISGGAMYSRNKANNSSYDNTSVNSIDSGRLTEDSSKVIFDGKLMDKDKMPAVDYNTPWRAFANISVDFPKIKLNWSTRLNYAAGYSQYTTSSERCPAFNPDICGSHTGSVGVHEKEKLKNAFTVDFGLTQTIPIGKNKLDLKLDIINAFDTVVRAHTSHASTSTSNSVSYKLGRQFWFEAKYSW